MDAAARQRAIEVGSRIRATRKAKRPRMTQLQLAVKAGMERTDVNAAENGRLTLGSDRLARIAGALEVSVLELRPEAEADAPGLVARPCYVQTCQGSYRSFGRAPGSYSFAGASFWLIYRES
jgi:transcriptional regulator with XRE-family HTH domain